MKEPHSCLCSLIALFLLMCSGSKNFAFEISVIQRLAPSPALSGTYSPSKFQPSGYFAGKVGSNTYWIADKSGLIARAGFDIPPYTASLEGLSRTGFVLGRTANSSSTYTNWITYTDGNTVVIDDYPLATASGESLDTVTIGYAPQIADDGMYCGTTTLRTTASSIGWSIKAAWSQRPGEAKRRLGFTGGEFSTYRDGILFEHSQIVRMGPGGHTIGFSDRASNSPIMWLGLPSGATIEIPGLAYTNGNAATSINRSGYVCIPRSQDIAGSVTICRPDGTFFTVGPHSSSGSFYSAINEAGYVGGSSSRNTQTLHTTSAWGANINGVTQTFGFYDSDHTSSGGYQTSSVNHWTSSGYFSGTSLRNVSTDSPGISEQSAWIGKFSDGQTVRVGLMDSDHTSVSGKQYSQVGVLSEDGWCAGSSNHYRTGTGPTQKTTAWIADTNGNTVPLELRDAVHMFPSGPSSNLNFTALGPNTDPGISSHPAGAIFVAGQSPRIDGGSTAWIYQKDVAQITPIDLSDGSTLRYVSTIRTLSQSGYAFGYYQIGSGGPNKAFMWDKTYGARDLTDLIGISRLATIGCSRLTDVSYVTADGTVLAFGVSLGTGASEMFLLKVSGITLPTVSALPPSSIGVNSATLNGIINPHGDATTAVFEYGLSTSYGSTASIVLVPNGGTTDQNIEVGLTDLLPNTTYHYRVRAQNSAGTVTSTDATFTTRPMIIVFIPGIAGSVLTIQTSPPYQVWPSVLPFDINALSFRPNPGWDIRAVDVVRSFATKHFYDNFINHLAPETGGKYKEFKLEGDPTRLASSYMVDYAQTNPTETRPTLFLFPYDWRRSNASHVEALHQYIGRIQELHGGAKVSVVAHSMGGLLLRRYLLDKGTGSVDKVVTIASPFWGAPMAVYRMATGNFFDPPIEGYDFSPIDALNRAAMKKTLVTLPGAHELLPSDAYLQNAGISILSEDGWDLDGNGGTGESYSHPHYWNVFDDLIRKRETEANATLPFDVPSVLSSGFHTERQDSSYQDATASPAITVPTLHLFGRQIEDKTPIGVVAKAHTVGVLNPKNEVYYDVIKGAGDETVPVLSAERTSAYRWSGAITRQVWGQADANHNGLMSNQVIWDYVDDFLDDGLLNLSSPAAPSLAASLAGASAVASSTPMKRILILGAGYVRIRDASGNTNARVSDISVTKIPGVDVRYGGDEPWVIIECAANNDLTIEKDSASDSLEIEVTYLDTSGTATGLNRFRFAPSAAVWQMNLGSAQSPTLKVDADNSGTLEATEGVPPTHTITGGTVDTTQPQVSVQLSVAGGMVTATLSGMDGGQAPNVFYSLNSAAPQAYSTSLGFPIGVEGHLKVFAEDAAGNTSGLIETTVNPNVAINQGTGSTITLRWPIADAYILEETTTLAGDWVPSAAQVTRSGLTDAVTISTGTDTRKFFRLRSRTVTK